MCACVRAPAPTYRALCLLSRLLFRPGEGVKRPLCANLEHSPFPSLPGGVLDGRELGAGRALNANTNKLKQQHRARTPPPKRPHLLHSYIRCPQTTTTTSNSTHSAAHAHAHTRTTSGQDARPLPLGQEGQLAHTHTQPLPLLQIPPYQLHQMRTFVAALSSPPSLHPFRVGPTPISPLLWRVCAHLPPSLRRPLCLCCDHPSHTSRKKSKARKKRHNIKDPKKIKGEEQESLEREAVCFFFVCCCSCVDHISFVCRRWQP
jgi:hypothetical protein